MLKIDFPMKGKLEIKVNGKYCRVSPNIFRSWHGERRLDGKPFKGEVYYFGTNDVYRENVPRPVEKKEKGTKLTPKELGPIRIKVVTSSRKSPSTLPLVKSGRTLVLWK
mgnify:CR=1 FL=1